MGKENPQHNLATERAISLVNGTVAEVATSSTGLLQDKWIRAQGNLDLPIYTYTQTLLEAGVDEVYLQSLMGLLKDLRIDVNDPHTSSSELSVIAGILAEDLVGIDLTRLRRQMDRVGFEPLVVRADLSPQPPDVFHSENEVIQYEQLTKLKEWQRALIASEGNYLDISRVILEQNNQALEAITRGHLPKFWRDNGIDERSKATVFIRDHKTYAGDIDFYYWGPEPEKCTLEMSRYLMSLGYKVDHRSNIFVDDLIRSGGKIDNGFLAAYLQMYFYMGKAIEFNGDSFEEHYAQDVTPVVDIDTMWRTAHKSLIPVAEVVSGVYTQNIPEYPGLKDYPFRLLTVTLMGLAMKYDIPFVLNHEDLIDKLVLHVSLDEASVLRNSFYHINQARNLYQLVSGRRWEMMTPEIKREIDRALVIQSGSKIEDMAALLADKIKSISIAHFGEPENGEVLDLNESRELVAPFVAQSYRKVAERYKQIARL
jgi:hypothetical protein